MIDIDFIYSSPYFDIAKKYNISLVHVTSCTALYFKIGDNVYSLSCSEYMKFRKYYKNLKEMLQNGDFTEQEIDDEIVRIISNNSDHYHVNECENLIEFENKIKNMVQYTENLKNRPKETFDVGETVYVTKPNSNLIGKFRINRISEHQDFFALTLSDGFAYNSKECFKTEEEVQAVKGGNGIVTENLELWNGFNT